MLTPEISVEIAKSDCVTWRPQPPSWMRRGARLNEDQNCGELPTSVGGGVRKEGSVPASAGSLGPWMASVAGSVTLAAPCGGWSGLPKVAAVAAVTAMAAPPVAVVARMWRRESALHPVLELHGTPPDVFWFLATGRYRGGSGLSRAGLSRARGGRSHHAQAATTITQR